MLATVTLAAACAAVVWLLVPPPADAVTLRGVPAARAGGRPLASALLIAVPAGALVVLVEGVTLALGLVVLCGCAGALRLIGRVRRRHAARVTADLVVEVCEALAGELRAGRPPVRALRDCVEVWPSLEAVATAGELGADVPEALRRLAREPGASGLVDVAGAWQVGHEAGGSIAPALGQVADAARRHRATERMVASELSSAQATARLVAVLPVGVLAMGSGLGADPWGFLLRTPVGVACLGAGLGLAYLGLAWIERIAAEVER